MDADALACSACINCAFQVQKETQTIQAQDGHLLTSPFSATHVLRLACCIVRRCDGRAVALLWCCACYRPHWMQSSGLPKTTWQASGLERIMVGSLPCQLVPRPCVWRRMSLSLGQPKTQHVSRIWPASRHQRHIWSPCHA